MECSNTSNHSMDKDTKQVTLVGMSLCTILVLTWLVAWCIVRVTEIKGRAAASMMSAVQPKQ